MPCFNFDCKYGIDLVSSHFTQRAERTMQNIKQQALTSKAWTGITVRPIGDNRYLALFYSTINNMQYN